MIIAACHGISLEALDADIEKTKASSDVKQGPLRPAFCRMHGNPARRSPVSRNMADQPAESSGSVFHGTKRGPDHVSGRGKAPRTE